MAIVPNQLKCDVCGAESSETSTWLVAATIPPTPKRPGEVGIGFAPIETPTYDRSIKVEHICSHACAVKRFSQWLGTL